VVGRVRPALARLLDALTPDELARKKAAFPASHSEFDRDRQVRRVTAFIADLLGNRTSLRPAEPPP